MDFIILLFLFLVVSVITDLRRGKIPNWLIVMGLVSGIYITNHFYQSILIVFFIILIFFPLFHIGTIGAGDIKSFAVIGFYLTVEQLIMTMFYTFLLAAVYGGYRMLYYHSFSERKNNIRLAPFIFAGVLISVGGTYL